MNDLLLMEQKHGKLKTNNLLLASRIIEQGILDSLILFFWAFCTQEERILSPVLMQKIVM